MSSLRPPSPSCPSHPRCPVAAVLADRLDDAPVVDVAVRLAAARGAPLLLIAVMPPLPPRAVPHRPDGPAARAVLGRAMPRVTRAGITYRPAVYHRPAGRGGRLDPAKGLLYVAVAHGGSSLVVSRSGPPGLDAGTVTEAAALRGGPVVHAAAPAFWAPLAASG